MRNQSIKNHGINIDFVDKTDIENVRKAVKPNTKLLWVETPTNPTLKLIDIKAICALAKEIGAISVVDNTFATPYL